VVDTHNHLGWLMTGSIGAADTKLDRLFQSGFHRRGWKQRERISRNCTVVPGALDGVLQRTVLGHQTDGIFEVGVRGVRLLESTPPECSFVVLSAPKREHDGQGDLAFAKIVADVLPELGRLASIIERIIDELECDTEVHAE